MKKRPVKPFKRKDDDLATIFRSNTKQSTLSKRDRSKDEVID